MGRPKKQSYEQQLKEKYGDKIENLEPYINLNTKILHRCNYHNYEYCSTPSSVLSSKHGCPKCGKESHHQHAKDRMAYTTETYKKALNERFGGNIICLEEFNGTTKPILHKCLKHNYEYKSSPASLLKTATYGCKYCGAENTKNKLQITLEDFNKRVIEYSNGKYEAISYNGWSSMAAFKHNLSDGTSHTFEMFASALFKNGKCYCENEHLNKLVIGYNDIKTKRPDLIEFLNDKEDAIKHTFSESTKINWKCPDCGSVFTKSISDVTYHGLSCPNCSDGISYPNKFIYNILCQVKDSFSVLKREYSPDWCKFSLNGIDYRTGIYDIYFVKEGKEYIVEMDGGFHNRARNNSKISINEVKMIDHYKDKLAKEHNIEMIRIDCDYGNTNRYNFILNKILSSRLADVVDLSQVNFDECNKQSLKSTIIQAIDLWNKGYGTTKIIKALSIGETTLREYLRQGNEIGLCSYTPEEGKRRGYYKSVYCKELDMKFTSLTEAAKKLGLDRKYISLCCRGKREYYGNVNNQELHWEFIEELVS